MRWPGTYAYRIRTKDANDLSLTRTSSNNDFILWNLSAASVLSDATVI